MSIVKNIQQALKDEQLDAIIISNPMNRRYATGFTGTAGIALVSQNDARFITDFRYVEQANDQATSFKIIEHTSAIETELNKQLKLMNAERVAFEKETVTYSTYERLKKSLEVELVPFAQMIESLRLIKTEEELEVMKQAAQIADDAYDHIQKYIKAGVREIDIATELEFFMRKQGATSSSFDIIVASGERSALPHGVASNKRIENGELVTLDYGALFNGYCSDITRTIAVGEISEELNDIYHTVLNAQLKGVEQIGPHMTGQEADAIPRDYIDAKGYGQYFGHSTGHGIGLDVHEAPRLSKLSTTELKCGMVVTVEPGIYINNVGGCRIEDEIVITETGNERLTHSTKELIIL
ncbi:MAG TPA: Xaa-Pro peptidase family protein [Bacillota bacterium]|nr:Xaa-Pro peptidase family protein [Bacillota bacterium]